MFSNEKKKRKDYCKQNEYYLNLFTTLIDKEKITQFRIEKKKIYTFADSKSHCIQISDAIKEKANFFKNKTNIIIRRF